MRTVNKMQCLHFNRNVRFSSFGHVQFKLMTKLVVFCSTLSNLETFQKVEKKFQSNRLKQITKPFNSKTDMLQFHLFLWLNWCVGFVFHSVLSKKCLTSIFDKEIVNCVPWVTNRKNLLQFKLRLAYWMRSKGRSMKF